VLRLSRSVGALAGLSVTVIAASAGVTPAAAVEPATTPEISVGTDVLHVGPGLAATPLPAAIIGGNHRWLRDGLGMWDSAADAPVPSAVQAARAGHLDTVRYPAGTVANMFDFKRAIGPQAARGCQTAAGFVGDRFAPTDSRYGPDENERFVDSFGGQTMVMVPTINQSARDAADYVEYMNAPVGTNPNGGVAWAALRAANGHPEPYGITVWEVGNEPYLPNQRYWRSPDLDTKVRQYIEGGWQRQTADSAPYVDNDGLFAGCDLAHPVTGTGEPDQVYRTRYRPIALAEDATAESGPIADPVLTVNGERWERVDSLRAASKGAKVYEVVRASGEIRFGDGAHGMVPPEGARFSIEYTTGRQDGFLDYDREIKAVDPTVSVCSGWGKVEFVEAMGSRPYDCLGVHMYTSPVAGDEQYPVYSTEQLYHDLLRRGAGAVDSVRERMNAVAAQFPDPATRPFLAITEYGILAKRGPTGARMPWGFGARLMYSLYLAELVMGQIENGAQLATRSNLNPPPPRPGQPSRPDGVIGGPPNFFLNGGAQMLNLFAATVGSTAVVSSVSGNPVATDGDYPALRVLGMRGDDGVTRILVVNRDIEKPLTARVDLGGLSGDWQITAHTFNGPAVDAYNTYDDLDNLTTNVEQATASGSSFVRDFPAHSVTLLEVRAA